MFLQREGLKDDHDREAQMPSSVIRTVTDVDEYRMAANRRLSGVELTVTARGAFAASITRIDLHRLWMQRRRI